MAIVRYRLDPAAPPEMSPETKARMAAMSDEEIERRAAEDLDNPPLGIDATALDTSAVMVRRVLGTMGLSLAQFAARYRVDPVRLRDWQRGRATMDSIALAYLSVIEKEMEAVDRALSA